MGKEKKSNKFFVMLFIIIAFIILGAVITELSPQEKIKKEPLVTQNISTQGVYSNNSVKNNEPDICTKVNFSNWSLCSEKGTRIRSITSMYPQGCKLGSDVIQQESCAYVPIKLDAETLLQEMFQQISQTSGKTIETEYIAGEYGDVVNIVKYSIANDGNLVIWMQSKNHQSDRVISDLFLRDSNKDFRPDIFSNDGAEWYPIDIQSQEDQIQIMMVWAVQLTYFTENLLK